MRPAEFIESRLRGVKALSFPILAAFAGRNLAWLLLPSKWEEMEKAVYKMAPGGSAGTAGQAG